MNSIESVELILDRYLPPDELASVKGILYGLNCGQPVSVISPLDASMHEAASKANYDLQGPFAFRASPMQLRPERRVRVALIQNKIVLPTTDPYLEQAKVRWPTTGQLLLATATCFDPS